MSIHIFLKYEFLKKFWEPDDRRPEVLVAFSGDLSRCSILLAVYSFQLSLHYNLGDHLLGLQ